MQRWLILAPEKPWEHYRYKKMDEWRGKFCADFPKTASPGDPVLLWRRGRDGGIVAVGTISSVFQKEDLLRKVSANLLGSDKAPAAYSPPQQITARIKFDLFRLSRPVTAAMLESSGFQDVAVLHRKSTEDSTIAAVHRLNLEESRWERLGGIIEDVSAPTKWPIAWAIPEHSIVERAKFHSIYGGNPRALSSGSAKSPNIFLFLRPHAKNHEGRIYWEDRTLIAPGHAETYEWISFENLNILTHFWRGIPLRIFEAKGNQYVYVGEFVIDQNRPIQKWASGEVEVVELRNRKVKSAQIPLFRFVQLSGTRVKIDGKSAFFGAPSVDLRLDVVALKRPLISPPGRTDAFVPNSEGVEIARHLLDALEKDPRIREALAGSDCGRLLAQGLEIQRRRTNLARLRTVVENPGSLEGEIYHALKGQTWIFGGRFVGEALRRELTTGDVLDIPLICGDGTLHVVELKQANIKRLVDRHHSHFIPGTEVHKAVCQAQNYLRSIDEERASILAKYGIECRRALATVVIGHTNFVTNASKNEVLGALRTYNSDHSRVEVITFDQLVEGAERALGFADQMRGAE